MVRHVEAADRGEEGVGIYVRLARGPFLSKLEGCLGDIAHGLDEVRAGLHRPSPAVPAWRDGRGVKSLSRPCKPFGPSISWDAIGRRGWARRSSPASR